MLLRVGFGSSLSGYVAAVCVCECVLCVCADLTFPSERGGSVIDGGECTCGSKDRRGVECVGDLSHWDMVTPWVWRLLATPLQLLPLTLTPLVHLSQWDME